MISWSKLCPPLVGFHYNNLAGRLPMDLTCGKAINSMKTRASIHSAIILRASVVTAAKSREPAESAYRQPLQATQIG
jgi:hypothetical protein